MKHSVVSVKRDPEASRDLIDALQSDLEILWSETVSGRPVPWVLRRSSRRLRTGMMRTQPAGYAAKRCTTCRVSWSLYEREESLRRVRVAAP